MSRDNFYLVLGIAVFVLTFLILYLATELSLLWITGYAFLASIVSDVIIVFDNERRNAAPDAKFHHRNELVGETAVVIEDFIADGPIHTGKIEINGEKWLARSGSAALSAGDQVMIIDRTGMTFTVEKC